MQCAPTVRLIVKRPSYGRMYVEVPDDAPASLACALIAWAGGLPGMAFPGSFQATPGQWRLAYGLDSEGNAVRLQLDQTVADLPPGKDVFLVSGGEDTRCN